MIIGNPRRFGNLSEILAIRVENKLIKRVKMTKCLGNIIDQHLTWEDHIEYVSKKIRRNIDVLKRLRNVIPRDSLITRYKTLIEPHFRYRNTVWGYCNETLIQKLQVLQNRASRVIRFSKYECTDHSKLLKSLNWLSICHLINYDTAVLMYKVYNNAVSEQINELFTKSESTHHYLTRYASNNNFLVKFTTTEKGKRAISVADAKVWNNRLDLLKRICHLKALKQS